MSAERVSLIPQCEECCRVWLPHERDRGRACLDDEDNLVFCCPDCAEGEFDE